MPNKQAAFGQSGPHTLMRSQSAISGPLPLGSTLPQAAQ
jgi:hypothetical protein